MSLFAGSIPSFSAASLRSSLRFLVPSVLYALNNNIYFLGLTLVPPPIWLILCSARTAITACIYKVGFAFKLLYPYRLPSFISLLRDYQQFWLKRPLTGWQFVGAFFIVASIILAKLPDLLGTATAGVNSVPLLAIILALVASSNSGLLCCFVMVTQK